jgi:hypothetical protein
MSCERLSCELRLGGRPSDLHFRRILDAIEECYAGHTSHQGFYRWYIDARYGEMAKPLKCALKASGVPWSWRSEAGFDPLPWVTWVSRGGSVRTASADVTGRLFLTSGDLSGSEPRDRVICRLLADQADLDSIAHFAETAWVAEEEPPALEELEQTFIFTRKLRVNAVSEEEALARLKEALAKAGLDDGSAD